MAERRTREASDRRQLAKGDDLLRYNDIAAMLGVDPATVRGYRRDGRLPEPDDQAVPDRPRWRRSTIEAWNSARPGIGAPGKPRRKRGDTAP
jgi:predicted DNA-binding transcriptional regulator AlpA